MGVKLVSAFTRQGNTPVVFCILLNKAGVVVGPAFFGSIRNREKFTPPNGLLTEGTGWGFGVGVGVALLAAPASVEIPRTKAKRITSKCFFDFIIKYLFNSFNKSLNCL
jgi:hypothetical protein